MVEEHAARYELGDEVQLGGRVEGALEGEDEGVALLGVLAEHGELDGDVVHRAVPLNHGLVHDLHRVDEAVEVAPYLEDLAVAALAEHAQQREVVERERGQRAPLEGVQQPLDCSRGRRLDILVAQRPERV